MVHWRRIYDKYGKVRIEITGGEPFIYPRFIEIVKLLSSIHRVKVTTNMSGDIETFVREIDPERVFLDLNFHPLFVSDLDKYIKKTLLLKNAGFKVPEKLYRIGELVQYTPFSRQTIHNYTTMGLIRESQWTQGGHRLYDETVFERLSKIIELRKTKTPAEVRQLSKACRITEQILNDCISRFSKFRTEVEVVGF